MQEYNETVAVLVMDDAGYQIASESLQITVREATLEIAHRVFCEKVASLQKVAFDTVKLVLEVAHDEPNRA